MQRTSATETANRKPPAAKQKKAGAVEKDEGWTMKMLRFMGFSWDVSRDPIQNPRERRSSLDCGLAEASVGLASETSMVAMTCRSGREDLGDPGAEAIPPEKIGIFSMKTSLEL